MQQVRKAIIPAAGLGTRFLPATKAQPKEMLTIVDKPAIQYIVEEIIGAGIRDITIITGRMKHSIEDHFDYNVELENELSKKGKNELLNLVRSISEYANVYFIRQKSPLGLGHAVLTAEHHIDNEPFLVVLGDDIVDHPIPVAKQLLQVREKYLGGSVIGVQQVDKSQVSAYGIIKPGQRLDEKTVLMDNFIEKPPIDKAPSNLACLGRYVLEPQIFEFIKKTTPGAGGEIQLTDAILRMIKNGDKVMAYDFDGKRYDTGDKFGYIQANIEFAMKHPEIQDRLRTYLKEYVKTL